MLDKIKSSIIPYLIGFLIMLCGWYVSILNVALVRFQSDVLFTKWTGLGFMLILIGAYLPGIYVSIMGKFKD